MRALARRLDKLDGRQSGHHWINVSVPKGWDRARAKAAGMELARAAGYRGEMSVFSFDHRGDTEPRLIGEGFELMISLLDEIAEEGRQGRIAHQMERALGEALESKL